MARFQHQKKPWPHRRFVLAAFFFLVTFLCFFYGIDSLSSSSLHRQKETLQNALTRGVTYCYALEGRYPESLEYLKQSYGLVYDEDRFFVDYHPIGSNIMPEITIIEKRR